MCTCGRTVETTRISSSISGVRDSGERCEVISRDMSLLVEGMEREEYDEWEDRDVGRYLLECARDDLLAVGHWLSSDSRYLVVGEVVPDTHHDDGTIPLGESGHVVEHASECVSVVDTRVHICRIWWLPDELVETGIGVSAGGVYECRIGYLEYPGVPLSLTLSAEPWDTLQCLHIDVRDQIFGGDGIERTVKEKAVHAIVWSIIEISKSEKISGFCFLYEGFGHRVYIQVLGRLYAKKVTNTLDFHIFTLESGQNPYTPHMKTIAIIWAGAAGLMTAATILESLSDSPSSRGSQRGYPTQPPLQGEEYEIHIFEKNKTPGNKVIISWGGRCNVTTSITDKHILASKYTRGWEFIRKAMGKFWPQKVYDWFESHGVPLKVQEDLRVFPISDDGHDIVNVFERVFAKYRDRVTLHYGEGVDSVISSEENLYPWFSESRNPALIGQDFSASSFTEADGFWSKWQEHQERKQWETKKTQKYTITTPKGSYTADIVVVTTGGSAYSHTGSTGDGYAFARALGHTITPLGPSLSSFLSREKWTHELSGLAFPEARIGELTWPILLTHFGISGPLSFMYSSRIAWEKLGSNSPKIIHLAPLADMDTPLWETFLKREFQEHPKKLITSILADKLPRRFVDGFVDEHFPLIRETYAASISKKDREHIAELLWKWIPITLIERRPGDEFVTAGGVNTDEIDPETMESRISKNLYFAGEVLNVDGYTGGFSLQICWASGYVAGRNIVDKI